MKTYTITEPDGTQWGCWAAPDAEAAIEMLTEAALLAPDLYPGFSTTTRFIVAEDSLEAATLPAWH